MDMRYGDFLIRCSKKSLSESFDVECFVRSSISLLLKYAIIYSGTFLVRKNGANSESIK